MLVSGRVYEIVKTRHIWPLDTKELEDAAITDNGAQRGRSERALIHHGLK